MPRRHGEQKWQEKKQGGPTSDKVCRVNPAKVEPIIQELKVEGMSRLDALALIDRTLGAPPEQQERDAQLERVLGLTPGHIARFRAGLRAEAGSRRLDRQLARASKANDWQWKSPYGAPEKT